jgi:hypothetical protein
MSSETEAEEKAEHYLKLNNKYLYEAEEIRCKTENGT